MVMSFAIILAAAFAFNLAIPVFTDCIQEVTLHSRYYQNIIRIRSLCLRSQIV